MIKQRLYVRPFRQLGKGIEIFYTLLVGQSKMSLAEQNLLIRCTCLVIGLPNSDTCMSKQLVGCAKVPEKGMA